MLYYSRRDVDPGISKAAYIRFIQIARALRYALIKFEEVNDYDRFVIVRHDVDVDIATAVAMAELEAANELASTYFIMLHNELYNALSASNRKQIRKIQRLGHSIGLHFSPRYYSESEDIAVIRKRIRQELAILSDIAGDQVKSVSLHQPLRFFLQNDVGVPGEFISAYDRAYFKEIKYLSDSSGDWRGENIHDELSSQRHPRIQFLSHPFLWLYDERPRLQERLEAFQARHDRDARTRLKEALNDPERGMILYE